MITFVVLLLREKIFANYSNTYFTVIEKIQILKTINHLTLYNVLKDGCQNATNKIYMFPSMQKSSCLLKKNNHQTMYVNHLCCYLFDV
jgi:hypothetical protein